MCAIIYLLENQKNAKGYVGFSKLTLDERWEVHVRAMRNGCNYALHRAIRLHREESFTREVITENDDEEYTFRVLENHFIELYDTMAPNGYNLTKGGVGVRGYKHTEESIAKMKKAQSLINRKGPAHPLYGKEVSAATRKKQSLAQMGHLNNLGRVQSDESKEKNRLAHLGSRNVRSHTWHITCPDGSVVVTSDRTAFCIERGLNRNSVASYAWRGVPYKGYYFKRIYQ